ncbi:MAG: Zn-dependent hydrolase [Saprospiraceae bacterium]|nr:Zn-dependent hydrolase [Saprospiraceae bacterium]
MLRIDQNRLWNRLMTMAEIGRSSKGGVCRVALTEEDRQGRDLFIKWCEAAACSIEVDPMGNIFARRAGIDHNLPAIMIGSHLDSQPTGGKFDGVYGVLAGLEVIECLNDHQIKTRHPIEIVSWTNEEGARFTPAMIGSGVFAGAFSIDYAYSRTDKEGKTLGEELIKIGYRGKSPLGQRAYKATFELHIEQGPILEAEGKSVGVVTGVQGIHWYDLILTGKETHAGPSPMSYRVDPVRAAIPLLQEIYELADTYAPHAKVTVGYLDASPGVKNTVPGQLKISLDFRHPDAEILERMDRDLKTQIAKQAQNTEVQFKLEDIWYSPPVEFDKDCIAAVQQAVDLLQIPAKKMVSGAGHDAVYLAGYAPTSMIFIPCEDGLSHNELENAAPADVEAGANVLLHAALSLAQQMD